MEHGKKDIFLAGYVSAQAGTYFNQVILVTELAEYEDEGIIEEYVNLFKKVKGSGKLYVDNIKYVAQVAGKYHIQLPDLPRHPDQYFKWIKAAQIGFSGDRIPKDIDTAYFIHASHLGDLTTSLYILDNYIYLHEKYGALDYSDHIQALLSDILDLKEDIKQIKPVNISKKNKKILRKSWKSIFEMSGQFVEFQKKELGQNEMEELGDLVNQLLDISSSIATKIADKI